MASDDFSLSSGSDTEVSEMEDYELEVEGLPNSSSAASDEEDTHKEYADDLLADEEWLGLYEQDRKEEEALETTLQKRLNGTEKVREWCQCGNCDLQYYCCCELEGCVKALISHLVLQDLPEDTKLTCITHHPGFDPFCLQKWSLQLASHKYRTKGKKKYGQTGSEESFLRSLSYREFSRLVYACMCICCNKENISMQQG